MQWELLQSDLYDFAEGKDLSWTSPDMTVSQFVHHWRKNNEIAYAPGAIQIEVNSTTCLYDQSYIDACYEINGLRSISKKYDRMFTKFLTMAEEDALKLIAKESKTDRFLRSNSVKDMSSTNILWASLDSVNHSIIKNKQFLAVTARKRMNDSQAKMSHTLVNDRELKPEHVYSFLKDHTPMSMTHSSKIRDSLVMGCSFTINVRGNRTVVAASNDYPINWVPSKKTFTGQMSRILGPRILPYNTSTIIDSIATITRSLTTYEKYFKPFREIVVKADRRNAGLWWGSKAIFPSKEASQTVFENVLKCRGQSRILTERSKQGFVQRCRRSLAKLSGQEHSRMLYLDTENWFYEDYSLNEFHFIAALGLVPKCKTLEQYKNEHMGVRAVENVRLIKEASEPTIPTSYTDLPF